VVLTIAHESSIHPGHELLCSAISTPQIVYFWVKPVHPPTEIMSGGMSNLNQNHSWKDPHGKRALGSASAICALLALPACATDKTASCDTPPPFFARVAAAKDVNEDALGRPLPTVVQFLQVKDSVKLERASFQKLWADPKVILGEDYLLSA